MSQAQWMENNDLLASINVSELADLPEQIAFPTGTYQFQWNGLIAKQKESDDGVKLQVTLSFNYQGVTELADPNEAETLERCEAGSEHKFSFFPHTEFGQGFLKRALLPLCQQVGIDNIGQLNEAMAGSLVSVTITRTKDKKDPTRWNVNVTGITKV